MTEGTPAEGLPRGGGDGESAETAWRRRTALFPAPSLRPTSIGLSADQTNAVAGITNSKT